MSRKITAKVKLGSKIQYPGFGMGNAEAPAERQAEKELWYLTFGPDYYGDAAEKNKEWASASPSLNFQITVRGDVADLFEQGASYTCGFVKDEPTEAQKMEEVPDGDGSA
jgi:hypothetical protein